MEDVPKFKLPRGWLAWTLVALGAIERIVGWGGSIDFVLARWDEPAWVGALMGAVVDYSDWLGLALLIGGIVLLIRSERRRNDALYGSPAPAIITNEALEFPHAATAVNAPEVSARVQELEQQLDQETKKSGILAAAERAKEDLIRVEGMMKSVREKLEFPPIKVPPGMKKLYELYYHQQTVIESVKIHAITMWKDKEGYQNFIAQRSESKNPLDYVCEDHEKDIYGTNEGKKRYMGMKRHIQATLDYLEKRRSMLVRTIEEARSL